MRDSVSEPQTPRKWRPSLGMITAVLIVAVVALPLVGLVFFRLYENQLIRQTEAELIAQSTVLAAVLASEAANLDEEDLPRGPTRPERSHGIDTGRFTPIEPSLDLTSSPILSDRPDPEPVNFDVNARLVAVVARMDRMIAETQKVTLAGVRVLDAQGVVIAGGSEVGQSFAHVDEVAVALEGTFASVLRNREPERPAPPIYSISRGARIRIFTAMPVFAEDRLVGVIYASRTPENILKHLYRERDKVAFASLLVLLAGCVIWWLFVRTVTRPIGDLSARADAIGLGNRDAIGPLPRHGTREVAQLTERFMTMAEKLSERSDYIRTFTAHVSHELKTPLSAIQAAAEVLMEGRDDMAAAEQARFLGNIQADAERMVLLLERLRDLARAENPQHLGATTLANCREQLAANFGGLAIDWTGRLDAGLVMDVDNLTIVLSHLFDNALRHGAKRVQVSAQLLKGDRTGRADAVEITVTDDGAGISQGNRDRIFEAFFTTRRGDGGTGMGLVIVRSMLLAHGGEIWLDDGVGLNDRGATFVFRLPRAPSS